MIQYIKGDLFSHKAAAKSSSILAHACNCRGSWGAGVAKVFLNKYPSTFEVYAKYCENHRADPSKLLGTTLLIPSKPSDPGNTTDGVSYVACLFTSDYFGAKKLGPKDIVAYTDKAMEDLKNQIDSMKDKVSFETGKDGNPVICMPKINAGLFGVPWPQTEEALTKFNDLDINVYVID
ncbi:Piso0_005528 [Millerozyma farinosa CBS 7064]|uniref:ADP-ribose 1''-phosphate phosphatase n=1 Tax=Pichia sorbitophila (strain ATCC MYA-4447 / BCRC 22081 / CBS 7064 / NBRC 10061 / NRRL Y-12695) TaxID=559304 RepID=G8XZ93_PICSO|nr:Piso0_005528 [Millerozyma farinosa CBS 7064]